MTDTQAPEEEEREYEVWYQGTATTHVTVTAKNALEATDLAYEELSNQLCHHCAHPQAVSFRSLGPVEREWPDYMEVTEVKTDGETVDEDEY